MPTIETAAAYATFINVFTCDPANQDEVVRLNVEIIEQVAADAPGFISASVHRSLDGTRVTNYLQWETAQHLADMQHSAAFRDIARAFAGLTAFEPHRYEVAHGSERR
jgi:quinol monooxygenase YgiN